MDIFFNVLMTKMYDLRKVQIKFASSQFANIRRTNKDGNAHVLSRPVTYRYGVYSLWAAACDYCSYSRLTAFNYTVLRRKSVNPRLRMNPRDKIKEDGLEHMGSYLIV